jgi:hypothetical protein
VQSISTTGTAGAQTFGPSHLVAMPDPQAPATLIAVGSKSVFWATTLNTIVQAPLP